MYISVDLLKRYESDSPVKNGEIKELLADIDKKPGINLDSPEDIANRKRMLARVAPENFEDAFERYNGDNDLLPVNYLEVGLQRSRAVGRLQYFDLVEKKPGMATGFLITPDLIMTNHHVFSEKSQFEDARIEFDYEYDTKGREKERVVFELDPEKFFYANQALDIAIIGVKATDRTGVRTTRERGYIVLNNQTGKAGIGDFASIIQHPEGHFKQIALRENRILDKTDPFALIYLSDTTKGSSGAPVFNDQWQIVAIHSAGVAKKNNKNQYLDKDGNPIPVIRNKIDASKIVWESNRGTRISAIVNHLLAQPGVRMHPLISVLSSPAYSDDKSFAGYSLPTDNTNGLPLNNALPVIAGLNESVHASPIQITISLAAPQKNAIPVSLSPAIQGSNPDLETKYEDELDFSECEGYDEQFMGGEKIPMPKPDAKLKKKLAHLVGDDENYILNYHHYSTIHHAVRKMPVVSAININAGLRYPELKGRDDKWFRDRRIDYDVQLDNNFYKKSGFDRGHLSRREDAEWGKPSSFAETAANYTCCFTNCCPQVPRLNQSKAGGEWGMLEIEMLEKGVKIENGKAGRITVFNGPVFDDEDPVFRGVQVPLAFWKIVVWRNHAGHLKSTGFVLKQDKLVDKIGFDKEELSFDKLFIASQCSIAEIEKLTGLSFGKVSKWDTFDKKAAKKVPSASAGKGTKKTAKPKTAKRTVDAMEKVYLSKFIDIDELMKKHSIPV